MDGRLAKDFASEVNCKQSICEAGQILMRGQLSRTRIPERFMDHKYQELGRWERTLDQNLYMKGFIPFLIPYHLPTGSCLFFRWRYWKASGLRFQVQRKA